MVSQKVAPEKKERKNFSKDTVDELKKWFAEHLDHPYPDEEDKEVLARKTKLNVSQVSYWFVNARKRIWQPLLHEKHAGNSCRAPSCVAFCRLISHTAFSRHPDRIRESDRC